MRLILPLMAVIASTTLADAGPDPRRAVLGCWDVGRGATLRLTAHKQGVWAEARFSERPRGGPQTMAALAPWLEASGEFEVSCRPRSQHGSFCRVSPEQSGGLR